MSEPLTSQDIRASAAVHGELGPDYSDAVVESFLEKIDKQIEARVEARLASVTPVRRRPVDLVKLARRRTLLRGAAIGTVAAGVPLSIIAAHADSAYGATSAGRAVVWIWVILGAIYGALAYRLKPPPGDD